MCRVDNSFIDVFLKQNRVLRNPGFQLGQDTEKLYRCHFTADDFPSTVAECYFVARILFYARVDLAFERHCHYSVQCENDGARYFLKLSADRMT